MPTAAWPTLPSHRAWLADHTRDLLRFGRNAGLPGGGGAWLTDAGDPWPERGLHTWITCRTVHVHALGMLLGLPGSAPAARAALAGLVGPGAPLRDGIGWVSSVAADGTVPDEKSAYAHAFVLLAGASASAADLPGGRDLLAEALVVLDRFWDEDAGLVVDTWDRGFTRLDPYRGINAAMHSVEAMLAAADVLASFPPAGPTTPATLRTRAARVGRFVVGQAGAHDWRLPEHYDAHWSPALEYHADRPDDPFRPYGATVGHGLEWSRLLLHLEAAGEPGEWLTAARALYHRAVTDGWAADGVEGFVYTTDWSGTPVVRDRMHWVVAEAIGAAAALFERTGEERYAVDYARWWDHAARHLIDPAGSWRHQLGPDLAASGSVWPGKADLYHAVQATLIPRLPLGPALAPALAAGLLRGPRE